MEKLKCACLTIFLLSLHTQNIQTKANELRRPNIIIFLVDDLGYGDLGYTGHPTNRSPNIDRLAAAGQVLTQFYSASAVCTPSRAALLTGRHAVRSGMYPGVLLTASALGLPLEEVTMAEILAEAGYRTGMVGKWHLGVGEAGEFLPTHQGFSEYYGVPYSHDMCPFLNPCYPEAECDAASPHPLTSGCPLFEDEAIVEQPVRLTSLSQRMGARAQAFIRESVQAREPFFLYYSFNHVHFPQFSGPEYRNSSAGGSYGDSVAELDSVIGDIMATLEETGVYEDTLVVFTSDNGARTLNHGKGQGGNNGQFRCGKGTTYEGGHRVPAIISYPAMIPSGVNQHLMSSLDLLPTISGLLSLPPVNKTLDGFDISRTLLFDEPSPRNEFAFIQSSASNNFGKIHALRLNEYKAHFYTEGNIFSSNEDLSCISLRKEHNPPLLYNVAHDPGERYEQNADNLEGYEVVMAEILARRETLEQELVWAESRTGHISQEAIPCCNKPCVPFPSCCSCDRV